MSKKLLIILVSVVLGLFLVSLVGYYFIMQGSSTGGSGETSVFRNFFPFGGNDGPTVNENGGENQNIETPTENPAVTNDFVKKLRKLSAEPTAGAGVLDVKAGTLVRYIEKATGHIYEVEMFSPNKSRISNTTIPVVYDAVWGNKNSSLITRYLQEDDKTVDTYSMTVKEVSTTTENTITGVLFPEKIIEVSALDTSVFYLQEGSEGSVGYTSSWSGTNRKIVWNSPLKQLSSQYVNTRTVSLTTKPYPGVAGFVYFVDTVTGVSKKILGPIPGLTTLSDSSLSYVLYLSQNVSVGTYVFDIKNQKSTQVTPTTFPEKCVWSKKEVGVAFCAVPKGSLDENSLTSWYRGYISYTDDIWKYDTKNNTSNIILDLSDESGEVIDVIKPILSDNEQYIIFTNKIDNSLWSLDVTK